MKNILPIFTLFISVNFYSQIVHPLDGDNTVQMNCGQIVSYFDPGGDQGNYTSNVMESKY